MTRNPILVASLLLASFFLALGVSRAQDKAVVHMPAADGGVFVTPVPGAPFSAEVVREMTQVLKDGSSFQRTTAATIARDSQGRIHNESHEVLPASSTRKPALYSIHIYDPETRLSTILNLHTHIASQQTLANFPATEPPSNWWMHLLGERGDNSNMQVQALGPSVMAGRDVHGYRRTMTVPAKASGTDRAVVVTDEIWYSEELRINLLARHNDPRTGEVTTTVTQINPNEPEAELFAIPPDYKVVDVTPREAESPEGVKAEP
jgi:hypothetical protein